MPISAQKSRVFAGSLNWSGYLRGFSLDSSVDVLDTTTLADTAMASIPGQDTSTSSFDLLLDTDTTTGGQWSVGTTWETTNPQPLAFCPSGTTLAAECFVADSILTQLSTTSAHNAAVAAAISTQTTGPTEAGQVIADVTTAVTIDGNGTAVDGGAATANGGVAQIHVTGFSGLTNDVITVEHSVDGVSSWATLATFATVSGLTSERVVVAPATTVRRYLRVVDNVTGSGSISRSVHFARR